MSKKVKIAIVILIVAAAIAPFAAYFLAISSEPYRLLEENVKNSIVVKEVIGDVTSVRLAPFGYAVRYSGPRGWAHFETEVTGTKATGTIFVNLEKKLGEWQVINAKLNGDDISLSKR